jgi:hypothetical protein
MKRVLTAAAAAFAFTFATPAQAATIGHLLDEVKLTGTSIAVDIPRVCGDKGVLGKYEFKTGLVDQLTICIDNHKGDETELVDTVLHEAVHIVQACKGGPVYTRDSLLDYANAKEVHFVATQYNADEFHDEIEARVIAAELNPQIVIDLLRKHCYE